MGIKDKINILAGNETKDKIPVEYNKIGKTDKVAAIVVDTSSRNPNFIGINLIQFITFGVINKTPKVAKNESWKEISIITLGL